MPEANLPAWEDRAVEEANLLNPAFLSLVAFSVCRGYESEVSRPIDFFLPFIALPLVTTSFLRDLLPRTVRTKLAGWLHENEGDLLDFGERAAAHAAWVRQGLAYGIRFEALEIEGASLRAGSIKRKPRGCISSDEVEFTRQRAFFVGRWFATAGSARTIAGLFGVRP